MEARGLHASRPESRGFDFDAVQPSPFASCHLFRIRISPLPTPPPPISGSQMEWMPAHFPHPLHSYPRTPSSSSFFFFFLFDLLPKMTDLLAR